MQDDYAILWLQNINKLLDFLLTQT